MTYVASFTLVSRAFGLLVRTYCPVLIQVTDIKPQNILIETPDINGMFEKVLSEAFQPYRAPLENDFYMVPAQVSSAEDDIPQPTSFRSLDGIWDL